MRAGADRVVAWRRSAWIDPLVGASVTIGLTPALQLSILGDWGGWDAGSAFPDTWQVIGLLGAKLSEDWSLRLRYRALAIERDLADIEFRGPIAGVL